LFVRIRPCPSVFVLEKRLALESCTGRRKPGRELCLSGEAARPSPGGCAEGHRDRRQRGSTSELPGGRPPGV